MRSRPHVSRGKILLESSKDVAWKKSAFACLTVIDGARLLQARLDALERERVSLSEQLKGRELDVNALVEQKGSLEAEVSRAQRALSRGAVETASLAQGELMLQARGS